jgi:hypothetical protein
MVWPSMKYTSRGPHRGRQPCAPDVHTVPVRGDLRATVAVVAVVSNLRQSEGAAHGQDGPTNVITANAAAVPSRNHHSWWLQFKVEHAG